MYSKFLKWYKLLPSSSVRHFVISCFRKIEIMALGVPYMAYVSYQIAS